MNYIVSYRQRIFENLLTLQKNIKNTLSRFKSYKEGIDKCYANDAREGIQRADIIIYRLINYSYDDANICSLLEAVLKSLHQVILELQRKAPHIVKYIHSLYNQVIALLPEGTAIQLELFDVGSCHNPMAESLVLACIKQWLNKVSQWWSERVQFLSDRFSEIFRTPVGEQLLFELAF